MDALFRFPTACRIDPGVEAWFNEGDALRSLIKPWYECLRACGPNVRELMHDGRPTACVDDAAFAYVDAYTEHANIGFFFGAFLPDPAGIVEGAGKRMRHVRLSIGRTANDAAVRKLITAAYQDMRRRLEKD